MRERTAFLHTVAAKVRSSFYRLH